MGGGIFLLQDDGKLVEMNARQYDSESILQQLLASYPNLLAGDQIDGDDPRRWLLVAREMAVPDEEDGAGRWSLDHLFLDQAAIPTLVEVKRSTDTRIRREVVGQMLDYAANAVAYWPVEVIRAQFENSCKVQGLDPFTEVGTLLGQQSDQDAFWQSVKTNLQAGRIRMVFVADEIPAELRRVVEFLNGQMDPAEVFAIEIKQFVGQGMKALAPRLIGQTAEAERKKSAGKRDQNQWDEISFFQELEKKRGPIEANVAKAILAWAKAQSLRIWWGKGSKDGSFFPVLDHKNVAHSLISVWTYGRIEAQFQWMQGRAPFNSEVKRQEFRTRLNEIPGIDIPPDAITRRPSIPLSALTNKDALHRFLETLDWFIEEVKSTPAEK